MNYPVKLKAGDTVRVLALSGPHEWAKPDKLAAAEAFFRRRGIHVSYGKHGRSGTGPLLVPTVEGRVQDMHAALSDPAVQAIWALMGGDNANQIIPHLDFDLFKDSQKIFVGHSDNAVLINALAYKTGVAAYYGPNFHAIGSTAGSRMTHQFIDKCLFSDYSYDLEPTKTWHDKDYTTQPPTTHSYRETKGWWPIQAAGDAGQLVGGEISTFALLQGTTFFPNLKHKILALEMYEGTLAEFDRLLESILLQKGADKLNGLMLGRFQRQADIGEHDLRTILSSKPLLKGLPIIANVDFGHTTPRLTLPIGGHVQLHVGSKNQRIRIGEH